MSLVQLFACWVIFHDFLLSPYTSKLAFSKNPFSVDGNNLDRDQGRHSARPDLCPKCLQRLSADNKIKVSDALNHSQFFSHVGTIPGLILSVEKLRELKAI